MALVAERVVEIGAAIGGAVAIANGQTVRYPAIAGLKTLPAGTVVPITKALCSACINSAQVVRCGDVLSENHIDIDIEECQRRGIQSLILAPIFHEGKVAGVLELYYSTPHAFSDQDVHTCQLMAGLVTEALVRDEEIAWKKSMAEERAAMLEALEKLQPSLTAMVDKPAAKTEVAGRAAPPTVTAYICRKCSHPLLEGEQFCGECGSPRKADYESPNMQSKMASLWHMQDAETKNSPEAFMDEAIAGAGAAAEKSVAAQSLHLDDALEDALEKIVPPGSVGAGEPGISSKAERGISEALEHERGERDKELTQAKELEPREDETIEQEEATVEEEPETALTRKATAPGDWSSAAAAREFLENLSSSKRRQSLAQFWNGRRGDVYLVIALILVACVIGWGVWSNHPSSSVGAAKPAAAHKKAAPDADLSVFERMLIGLGLAEEPAPVEDKGNPSVQVWVDERTALYYCPGAELYGKTSKGRFTSQREAQLDQFEPAYRKICN